MARTVAAYSTAHTAPRQQPVWQAMRIQRRFTTRDLLTTADCGESQVHKYCRALAQAGFLRLHQARVSGRPGSRDVWLLVRDSGPTAPIRRHDGSGVFDPNTGVAWGMDGLPIAKPTDHDAVARGLLAKLADQQRDDRAAPRYLAPMHEAAGIDSEAGHE